MPAIHPLTLPKWGLSMTQARVIDWLKTVGMPVRQGEELIAIESEKIAGAVESPANGVLRRQLVQVEQVVSVGDLLGVVAAADVAEVELNSFVADFQASASTRSSHALASESNPEKIAVGGRTLRYLKRGDGGPPAIFLHGFGGDLNNWLFNLGPLAASRSVYALDLPGHGESTKDVGAGTVEELAQAVASFMDAVGIPDAHFVGHSLGGAVALFLSARQPRPVRSLALIASAGLGPEIDTAYIEGFINSSTRSALKPHVMKLFADPSRVTRRMIDDLLKYKRLEGVEQNLRLLAGQLFSAGRQTTVLREELSRLPQPVLVIWGSDDLIIPASHASGLPPSIQVAIIPNTGHMVMVEAAGETNRLLTGFWESH